MRGGLHHEQEEVFWVAAIQQQARCDLLARQPVLGDEVAVAAVGFGGVQGNRGLGRIGVGNIDLVAGMAMSWIGRPALRVNRRSKR